MEKKFFTTIMLIMFVCSFLLVSGCAEKQDVADQSAIQSTPQDSSSGDSMASDSSADSSMGQDTSASQDEASSFDASNIYFDFDKSDLSSASQSNLKDKASWLENNSAYSVLISGHCDSRGSSVYNIALGDRRATAAKKFLNELGLSASRISTVSYGEEKPVDTRETEEAYAKNRRDEFQLVK